MIKTVLKEMIILTLAVAAIVLILTVVFYDSIPINKIVPEVATYTKPEKLEQELDKIVEEEQEIIVTYKIDEQDLTVYEKNNSYNPGKADPFAIYSTDSTPTTDIDGSNGGSGNSSNTGTSNSSSNGNASGSGNNTTINK